MCPPPFFLSGLYASLPLLPSPPSDIFTLPNPPYSTNNATSPASPTRAELAASVPAALLFTTGDAGETVPDAEADAEDAPEELEDEDEAGEEV